MKRFLTRTAAAFAALFLLLVSFCGCGISTQAAGPDPERAAVETAEPGTENGETETEPAETPSPENKEEQERQERLEMQEDGFLLKRGWLYAVDGDGEYLRDTYVGVLYFDKNGRYSSGSRTLDSLVARVIREHTDDDMSRMEKLREMYNYTRDNIRYIGFGNHDLSFTPAHGADGWMIETAVYALENESGNCYHFAAAFTALARGLGYQAYATAGIVGSEQQPHGWVEILDEDGNIWYCDPETEYSRIYWLQEKHDLFYKSKDGISETTGLGYMQQKDPFEPEAKEAEARLHPAASPQPADDLQP